MATLKEIQRAHLSIMEWADWSIRHLESSNIGYAKRTAEGRAMAEAVGVQLSGYFSSRAPDVMMPPRIAAVDRVMKDMPTELRAVITHKYLGCGTEGDKINEYQKATGLGQRVYYSRLELAKTWVAASLRRS